MNGPGLGRTVLELRADGTKYYPELLKAKKEALSLGGAFGMTRRELSTFAADSQKIGRVLTTSLSLPLALAGGAALKFALDFNKSMANVATLIPGNRTRVTELKAAIQEMAIATGQSTEDLAGGLYQVISAFGDTADSAKILEINARGAAAGVATTTDAINLTSAVTKSYGNTSAEAVQKVSDLAFQTVKLGQTTFPELAQSIGRVTPLAAELNVTQEELFGTMATFTGVTGQAAEVSTQLRGVLQALLSPTDKMKALYRELGVESGKVLIEQRGLRGAIQAIVDTAKSGGRDLKDYIGSIEGQTLALSAAGGQSETFAQKLAEMKKAAGATDQAFRDQTEGVNAAGFAWEQLKQEATVAAQQLGDELLPIIMDAVRELKPLGDLLLAAIRQFKNLPEPVKTATVSLFLLFAVLGPLAIGIGNVTTALNTLMASKGLALLVGFGPKLFTVSGAVAGFGAAVGAVVTSMAMKAVMAGQELAAFEADVAAVLGRSHGILQQYRDIHLPFEPFLRFTDTVTVTGKAVTDLTEAQEKLVEQFSGREQLAKARDYETVLRTIGGATRLTAEEQEDYRKVFAAVIEKYRQLGPAGRPVVEHYERLAAIFTKLLPGLTGINTAIDWTFGQTDPVAVLMQLEGLLTGLEDANVKVPWGFHQVEFGRSPLDVITELRTGIEDANRDIDWTFGQIEKRSGVTIERIAAVVDALRGFSQVFSEIAREIGGTAGAIADSVSVAVDAVGAILSGNVFSGFMLPLTVGRIFDELQRRENELIKSNRQLVTNFIETEGGVAALAAKLKLTGVEWSAWESYLKRAQRSARDTEQALASLTRALDALRARQAAAATVVELTGEMIADWLEPIRKAKDALTEAEKHQADAQKTFEEVLARKAKGLADDEDVKRAGDALLEAKTKAQQLAAELAGLKATSQETFESLAAYAVAAFAATFKTTGDFYGALQSVGPLLDDLAEGQNTLGLSGSDAISELLEIRRVQEKYQDFLTPLNTATRAVQALDAAGVKSDEAYRALGRDALRTYNAMIAGGTDARTAQALMQPTLQTLWKLWKDGKIAVDDETAALLTQAEEHGIVGKDQESINERMLETFQDLKAAIDLMTIAITDWASAAEEGFNRARGAAIAYGKAVPRGTPPIPGTGSGTAQPRPAPPGGGGDGGDTGGVGAWTEYHGGGVIRSQPVGASLWAAGHAYARAHTGLLVGRTALAAGDVPILAQTGEGLLSRDVGMPALGRWALQAMNAGEGPRGAATPDRDAVEGLGSIHLTYIINAINRAGMLEAVEEEVLPATIETLKTKLGLRRKFQVAAGILP